MLKISDKQKATAIELGRKHKKPFMWVNSKGEFFTEDQFAKASVGGDAKKYGKVEVTAKVEKSQSFADLNADDAIKAINEAADRAAVEAMLKAEQEGKKRTTVIAAVDAKLESFNSPE